MELIEDYITKPQSERQLHLRLEEPCVERGGMSTYCKGLMAHILDTTIPSGKKIHVCHACHNAKCSNPNHLYWGTPAENYADALANGRPKSPYHANVRKYGIEEANRRQRKPGNQNGSGNLGKAKSEDHRNKLSIAGFKASKQGKGRLSGRTPLTDPDTLKHLVETLGMSGAADKLGISLEAMRGRFYRL